MALYSVGLHKGKIYVGPLVDRDNLIPVIECGSPQEARRIIAERNLPYAEEAFKRFLDLAERCGKDPRDVVEIMLRKYNLRR